MSLYLRNATWIDPETFKATTTTIKVEEVIHYSQTN